MFINIPSAQIRMTYTIVSLGGSLLVPNEVDTKFIAKFTAMISTLVEQGAKFVLIAGGGKIARKYRDAAQELGVTDPATLDWVGIDATKLNARLLHASFGELCSENIINNPIEDEFDESKPIIVGAGWEPGCSTDFDAALIAQRLDANRIINLSNVAHVYSEDPRENPDAVKYDSLSWKEFREIIGDEWTPGRNVPFDPKAAQLCQEQNISVAILSADDLANVEAALNGKKFVGTLIE
jgi:uridylate kinase